MKYADHHGLPIVTFIDTPGAFADLKSEELGQVTFLKSNAMVMGDIYVCLNIYSYGRAKL